MCLLFPQVQCRKQQNMNDEQMEMVKNSGSIFRDLGHANPDIELMKVSIASEIIRVLNIRKLSVRKVGKLAEISMTFSKCFHGGHALAF